ncbi:hypothetical protein [Hyphobacterium marinum]|uniref:Secreted protein n=1 Tax=Hyphobacterium marinum TaxID=3116574 RepID=A0ABU7LXX5_9PROT|nr:hypothetical protein [Hyphobacterium sp. Y6023]MEE2566411.1 hypothetical protein [Hyphobacterium sp. Y6023]
MRTIAVLLASAAVFLSSADAQVGGVVGSATGTVDEDVGMLRQNVPGTLNSSGRDLLPRGASRLDRIAEQRARRAERRAAREARADGNSAIAVSTLSEGQAEPVGQTVDMALQYRAASDASIATRRASGAGEPSSESAGQVTHSLEGPGVDVANAASTVAQLDVRTPPVRPVLQSTLEAPRPRDVIVTARETVPAASVPTEIVIETPSVDTPSVGTAVIAPGSRTTVIAPGSPGYIAPARSEVVVYETVDRPASIQPAVPARGDTVTSAPQARPSADSGRSTSGATGGRGHFDWLPVIIGTLLVLLLLCAARRVSRHKATA